MEPVVEPVYNRKHPGTLAYKKFFYKNAIKGVLRPHRVIFKKRRVGRDDHFVLYPQGQKKWYKLFGVPEDVTVPFTYSDFSRAVGFMEVIEGLQSNFKHLLHLKSEIWFYRELIPGEAYIIDYLFEDVLQIKPDKAAMIGCSAISRNGEQYMKMRDHFVIKDLPPRDAVYLQKDTSDQFKGITRVPAEPLDSARMEEIYIPADLAKRYGDTSGDYNIVHTSPLMARLFGYERTFIQGLCSANLIMSRLCMGGIKLRHFTITFGRPVFMDSTVYLYYTDHEYRLQDQDNRVLCFGQINCAEDFSA
ncbi:MAG TPA: MaoC family dehydratase [Syntrophomonas sp.]|nr:MaoC family dehydratase [Syntrophomonas sp.]HRW11835.1 MaoC family dehydratase [Syntrophomonas sp.]